MDWLDERIAEMADERSLELDQHNWGDDDDPNTDGFKLALRVKGIRESRTVTAVSASLLADCGAGDPAQRGYTVEMMKLVLDGMAKIVADARATPTRSN